jgi:hypothetical protein
MRPLLKILRPLQQAAAAFFSHDLTVQRGKAGMRLVLEERAPGADRKRAPGREVKGKPKDDAELSMMLEQLRALLAPFPDARGTLRALVFVEHALEKKGLRALNKLPLDVLQRALEQLEGLVTNWSPRGLAGLRSRMAVAIIDREQAGPPVKGEADDDPTEAMLETVEQAATGPEAQDDTDEDALAAAYAALGNLAPAASPAVAEIQGPLGSPSARGLAPVQPAGPAETIKLRELQG